MTDNTKVDFTLHTYPHLIPEIEVLVKTLEEWLETLKENNPEEMIKRTLDHWVKLIQEANEGNSSS